MRLGESERNKREEQRHKMFRTSYGEDIFKSKYAQNQYETWADRTKRVVNWVCGDMDGTKNHLLSKDDQAQLVQFISEFKFMPADGTSGTVVERRGSSTTATY